MADISHLWSGDLGVGATGDLATSDDVSLVQQRVLRRLLTNQGDYIWQLTYGAGLAGMIGSPQQIAATKAVIRSQIFNEPRVATNPEPVIDVTADQAGGVQVNITYVDAQTGLTQALSFPVGA